MERNLKNEIERQREREMKGIRMNLVIPFYSNAILFYYFLDFTGDRTLLKNRGYGIEWINL